MTVFKMTEKSVTVSCRCGKENVFNIEDLILRGNSIYFQCPDEKCFGIGSILIGNKELKSELKTNCQKLVQTLGKRLLKMERIDKEVPFNEDCLTLGSEWEQGSEIEVGKIDYAKKKVVSASGEVIGEAGQNI